MAKILCKKFLMFILLLAATCAQAQNLQEQFFKAVDLNDSDEVATLLAQDKNLVNAQDEHGWTGLMRAASDGSIPVVRELLQAQAPVNVRNNRKTAMDIAWDVYNSQPNNREGRVAKRRYFQVIQQLQAFGGEKTK